MKDVPRAIYNFRQLRLSFSKGSFGKMEAVDFKKVVSEKRNMEYILDNLSEGIIAHDLKRRIIYFNRRAEEITGLNREAVLGKDCHKVFGGPFCGGRCSFQHGTPQDLNHLSYPLNILTKIDEPRRLEMEVLRINAGELEGFAGIIGRNPKMLEV
ncbi:MAG: PAS domain-containing protein [Deltaproteobacteria bacterium]|nr:PAS domain-containing protein [Deltaproteobacteria bacterium]